MSETEAIAMTTRLAPRTLMAVIVIAAVSSSYAFPPQTGVKPLDSMTPQDLRQTGVNTLTSEQQVSLNKWIYDFAFRVYKAASEQSAHANEYNSTGGGHWIDDNKDGEFITLEDGSIWLVDSYDQIDSSLWLPVTDIKVSKESGARMYSLTNTEDHEKVHAKFIGFK